jgi:serine kinase of HPr protein (carbohydrate metabolism regulator)
MDPSVTLHGTCVAFGDRAVLIRGEPGCGKSTLALELMESEGTGLGPGTMRARLVSDDQTVLKSTSGQLVSTAPATLMGKFEVRGLGIVSVQDVCDRATLALVVDLVPKAERLPLHQQTAEFLGLSVPLLVFEAGGGALAARVRTALNSMVAALP